MKKFIKHISILFVISVALLFVLDIIYTEVYKNSLPRNKTQYILSLKDKKIDYVFLGSSRVENTIMTSKIEQITKKSVLNLGTQGAKLSDLNIFLRLLVDNNIKIENLFVQIDYIYNFETTSDIVRSQSLPYIKSNKTINLYLKQYDSSYFYNYYIPFYRYATNDYRIGFREFVASAMNKKPVVNLEDGFLPLYRKRIENSKSRLPGWIAKSNKDFREIDSICRVNKIPVTYFCAPYCPNLENEKYLDSLEKRIPNFKDFSSSIKDPMLFQNCSHLSAEGAEKFTELLIKELNL
jgi:hypothetical protein